MVGCKAIVESNCFFVTPILIEIEAICIISEEDSPNIWHPITLSFDLLTTNLSKHFEFIFLKVFDIGLNLHLKISMFFSPYILFASFSVKPTVAISGLEKTALGIY